jgi:hypothetical protein
MHSTGRAGNDAEVHVAMPRLSGLPAYGRPPRPVPPAPRRIDADDFPLEAYRTDEERAAYLTEIGTLDAVLTEQRPRN